MGRLPIMREKHPKTAIKKSRKQVSPKEPQPVLVDPTDGLFSSMKRLHKKMTTADWLKAIPPKNPPSQSEKKFIPWG
jgi:hypothetical protein